MQSLKSSAIIIITILTLTLFGCDGVPKNNISQEGKAKLETSETKKVTLDSKVLDREMKMNIYLPKGYSSEEKYPVLYMIHGHTGSEDTWMPGLKLDKKADALIESNKIKPLIIVTPDIENSFGINSSQEYGELGSDPKTNLTEGLFEDYLYKEVISFIDANYSTIASKDGRYIGGLSMGGFAALHMAFAYPDMFSKAGGHSPALYLDEFPNSLDRWLYPNERLRRERDPVYIAQDKDLKSLKVYLDCGDKDELKFYEGCGELFRILQDKGVESEYHLNPGTHEGSYWEENAEKYLMFYAGI